VNDSVSELRWWPPEMLDAGRWGESVSAVLARMLRARDRGRFPQAVLLTGPRGLGREHAAVETAAALTCPLGGPSGCSCSSCGRARSGSHPDVAAVLPQGAKGQIGVDAVRTLVTGVASRPYEGRLRVWILDGVERQGLGAEAANAFLKTLEEPPEHARFLLLAVNQAAVLPTVRSRCQHVPLPGVVAASGASACDTPELTALAEAGVDVGKAVDTVRAALNAAFEHDLRGMIGLSVELGDEPAAFQLTAAGALSLIAGDRHAEELSRLASSLLTKERRTGALSLNRQRQLLSCLLSWYRELD
jgi:hypothetical protein